MKIINFFGAPGVGKSTLAAELFVYMKKQNYNVELAYEYAKDCVYGERHLAIQDQLYMLAKMNHKFQCFKNANVDYVICDSPLLLNIIYKRMHYRMNYLDNKIFDNFVLELNKDYHRTNIFVTKSNDILYQHTGRIQTEEEADNLSSKIEKMLIDNNEKYEKVINSKDLNIEQIFTIAMAD